MRWGAYCEAYDVVVVDVLLTHLGKGGGDLDVLF